MPAMQGLEGSPPGTQVCVFVQRTAAPLHDAHVQSQRHNNVPLCHGLTDSFILVEKLKKLKLEVGRKAKQLQVVYH
jgi:hypothetical protein